MPNASNSFAIKDATHFISDSTFFDNKMDVFDENIVNWENHKIDSQSELSPTNCSDENNEKNLDTKDHDESPHSMINPQEILPPSQTLPEISTNDELSIMLDLIGIQGLNLRSQLHMARVRENELLSEFIDQSESPAEILRRLFQEIDHLRRENHKLIKEFDQTKLDNQQQKQMLQDVLKTMENLKMTTLSNTHNHEIKEVFQKNQDNLNIPESITNEKETFSSLSVHILNKNDPASSHSLFTAQPIIEDIHEEFINPALTDLHKQISTLTAQNQILQLKYATSKQELTTKIGELNSILQNVKSHLHYTKIENEELKRLVDKNFDEMQEMAERIRALESALETTCLDNDLLNSQLDESLRILKNSIQEQLQIPQELTRENFVLQQHIKYLMKEKNALKKKLTGMKRRQNADSMYDEGSPLDESFHHNHCTFPKAKPYFVDPHTSRSWCNVRGSHSSSSEHDASIGKEQIRKKSRSKHSKNSLKLVTFDSENQEQLDDCSSSELNLRHSDILKDYVNASQSSKRSSHSQMNFHAKPQASYSNTPEELRLSDLQQKSPLPTSEHNSPHDSTNSWSYYAIAGNKLSAGLPSVSFIESQSLPHKGHELLQENKKFLEHLKRKSQEQIMQILKQDQEIDREIENLLKHASRTSLQDLPNLSSLTNSLGFLNSDSMGKNHENINEVNIHSRESSTTSLTSGISSSHDPSVLNVEHLQSRQSLSVVNSSHNESALNPKPENKLDNNISEQIIAENENEIQKLGEKSEPKVQEEIGINNLSDAISQCDDLLDVSDNISKIQENGLSHSQEFVSVPLENLTHVPSNPSYTNCKGMSSTATDIVNNLAKTTINDENSAMKLSSVNFNGESFV